MLMPNMGDVDASFVARGITAPRLAELAGKLGPGYLLFPNRVGNLSVVRLSNGVHIGFIDLGTDEFVGYLDPPKGES